MTAARKPPKQPRPEQPNGWVAVPSELLYRADLTDAELRIYAALLDYARARGHCSPSHAALAAEVHKSQRQVRELLAGLRDKGLIEWERRGRGRTNEYVLRVLPWAPIHPDDRRKTAAQAKHEKLDDRRKTAGGSRCTSLEAVLEEGFPPPPSSRVGRAAQHEEEDVAIAQTSETALHSMGMDVREARELAAIHDAATIDAACEQTRRQARVHPTAYLRRCLLSKRVLATEPAPDDPSEQQARQVAASLAEQERQAAQRMAELKQRWGKLSDARRTELLGEARRRQPILRDRPDDHQVLLVEAYQAMAEQDEA